MRCECCNTLLTPQECTRKFKISGHYTNSCTTCLVEIDLPTIEGRAFKDIDEDYGDEDESIEEPK